MPNLGLSKKQLLLGMLVASVAIGVAAGIYHGSSKKGIACGLASFIGGLFTQIWWLRACQKNRPQHLRNPLDYSDNAVGSFLVGAGIGGGIPFLISFVV